MNAIKHRIKFKQTNQDRLKQVSDEAVNDNNTQLQSDSSFEDGEWVKDKDFIDHLKKFFKG